MKPITGVHVQPPQDWTRQHWMVVADDGGLFCSCLFASTPEGGETRERAELIAKAVNDYLKQSASRTTAEP